MDFSIPPDIQELRDRVTAFMAERVYPAEIHYDDENGLPGELQREIQSNVKSLGMWAPHMPKQEGGLGIGVLGLGLINEILGRSPIGPALFGCAAPDAGNLELLHLAANPEQKERYMRPNLAGDIHSCFAMTEPEVPGSDPTTLRTRAVEDGDDYVINGHKWFITGANGASFAILMAVTDPEAEQHARATMFLVDTSTPGYQFIRKIPVMGYSGPGGHCELRFENLRVHKAQILGRRGEGFKLAQMRLRPGRIQHCMRWLGVAQRSFELMCRRAVSRSAFGSPLADKQTVQNWVADSMAEMQAARLMVLHAAWKMDRGEDVRVDISLIKFFGAKVLHDVIDRAIQVHGALGFSGDSPLEGFYREARAARLYDGPDEVHRMVAARRILKQFR